MFELLRWVFAHFPSRPEARNAVLRSVFAREGYGLEVIERVRAQTKGTIRLHGGNVHTILRDLEREGLLMSWERAPKGGRPRRYYKITETGIAAISLRSDAGRPLPR